MVTKTAITVAHGDGIGPEIMAETLRILAAAGAALEVEPIEIGAAVYRQGFTSGIRPEAWESLRRTKVLLKAPVTTPQGGGYKSLNVTIRKTLGLYANVRPCVAYHPFVATRHPGTDLVIVRENEEDLYAGIEHRQTDDVVQCLKLITRPGTERVVRYAFEYARAHGRRKVTCMTKDNIMKMTDGLFHRVFDEIAREYPDIAAEHYIVDIGTALVADQPERFDVVVLPNLYGDILSDVAAQITGSVGLGGSANVGAHIAMFEAIHGSAPDIAGKGVANPSGLLLAAVMMLVHVGQPRAAERVHNAWLCTIEDGVHTPDIWRTELSRRRAGTREFGDAVIDRLGQDPAGFAAARYAQRAVAPAAPARHPRRGAARKDIVGIDVFVHARDALPADLAGRLKRLAGERFDLQLITNRGVKVWPDGFPETFCTDHWRCRFMANGGRDATSHDEIVRLLGNLALGGVDFIKTEHLCHFDGEPGYALAQGQ